MANNKVAIIGAGNVGSTAAYTLMLDGAVSEIALIDRNKDKAEGEAQDLNHCMQFTKLTNIIAGDSFELVKDADVVVITAGKAQEPGQTRMDLLKTNAQIFKEIIPKITQYNKTCILLVVTNPLDVMTYLAWKLSGFDSCHVLGTGTVLDTARLRYLLGKHFKISPKDITAYVLGEHGDSEFVWWSKSTIAGVPLTSFTEYTSKALEKICEQTRDAARDVIEKKGSTFYAIAMVINKIVRAILLNQPRVFTVSNVIRNIYDINDVCLSLPIVVRKSGICQTLDVTLDEKEQELLHISARKIKENIKLIMPVP